MSIKAPQPMPSIHLESVQQAPAPAPEREPASEVEAEETITESIAPPPEQAQDKPAPVAPPEEAQEQAPPEAKEPVNTCTLILRCDTILNNIQSLKPEKKALVPDNGIILKVADVSFNPGESVFNILLRETKRHKIHMEFTRTPVYSSSYIEGINNLYEFDCGELSGWMYKVNGEFPGYGCSQCILKSGDVVEWVYTCDLGRDIGGYGASLGGAGEKTDDKE